MSETKDQTIARLMEELKELWKTVNEYEARAVVLQKTVDRQYAELAASREKLECGHPKSCWVEADTLCENCSEVQSQHAYYFTGHADPKAKCNNFKGDDRKAVPAFCTICAELAATRADAYMKALWEAKTPVPSNTGNFQLGFINGQAEAQSAIEKLITTSDAAAREEWIRSIRREALAEYHIAEYIPGAPAPAARVGVCDNSGPFSKEPHTKASGCRNWRPLAEGEK